MEKANLDNQLLLMEKYNLTIEEYFITELLFLACEEERHPEYLVKYISLKTKNDLLDILTSLKSKGIIKNKLPKAGNSFNPGIIDFNKVFLHNYKKYSNELGQDLMRHYPSIAVIQGREYNIQNYAKKFNSEEEFCYFYGKSIGWNETKHEEVVKLVEWAKETSCNLININIADFVVIKSWNKIKEFKENSYDGLIIDTMTVL